MKTQNTITPNWDYWEKRYLSFLGMPRGKVAHKTDREIKQEAGERHARENRKT